MACPPSPLPSRLKTLFLQRLWRPLFCLFPRTRKHSDAGCGRPEGGGAWAAKTVKRPLQQPAQPRCANYWAPLTHKQHPPQPAQPRHTNYWAPRTWKRHQQEHRPQRPTEHSDPTQHAKGRTGDCPGSRKETTTRRNVTQGGGELNRGAVTSGSWNNQHDPDPMLDSIRTWTGRGGLDLGGGIISLLYEFSILMCPCRGVKSHYPFPTIRVHLHQGGCCLG